MDLAKLEHALMKPDGCEYVQVKPDRVAAVLQRDIEPYLNASQDTAKYNLLNDPEAVRRATQLCKSKENSVVVLIVDMGNEAFVRIWLHFWYLATSTFRNVIIIAQDLALYDIMNALMPGHVLLEPASLDLLSAAPAQFRSPAFAKRVKRRYYQIALLSATGVNVLYSDTDVMLFCSLLETLQDSTQVRAARDKGEMCSGLIYMPAGAMSLFVMLLADASMTMAGPEVNVNQAYFNVGITAVKSNFAQLPASSFPSARLFWSRLTRNVTEVQALAQPAMRGVCYIHNNFISGTANKAQRFKDYGFDQNPVTDDHPAFEELQRRHS
jgi:hypothetical protein